uniref:AGC-kinase C-terminal domain-containing protein n=1 Tax=Strongyloides stercoralis TaxID=6248 RepID=A0A0K0ED29_STRER
MPFPVKDIPENAYTFMTNFNFNDSYIDNDELLKLCRFNEKLSLEPPRVRCFSQVCKFGEDVKISRRMRSLSQRSSPSTNNIFSNSQFVADFSKMNTESIIIDKKEPLTLKKFNFTKNICDDNDKNMYRFNFNKSNNYQTKCVDETVSKNKFIFEPSIDERCFNGDFIETNDFTSSQSDLTKSPLNSLYSIEDEIDSNQSKIPLKKEKTNFWRHLSQQEF